MTPILSAFPAIVFCSTGRWRPWRRARWTLGFAPRKSLKRIQEQSETPDWEVKNEMILKLCQVILGMEMKVYMMIAAKSWDQADHSAEEVQLWSKAKCLRRGVLIQFDGAANKGKETTSIAEDKDKITTQKCRKVTKLGRVYGHRLVGEVSTACKLNAMKLEHSSSEVASSTSVKFGALHLIHQNDLAKYTKSIKITWLVTWPRIWRNSSKRSWELVVFASFAQRSLQCFQPQFFFWTRGVSFHRVQRGQASLDITWGRCSVKPKFPNRSSPGCNCRTALPTSPSDRPRLWMNERWSKNNEGINRQKLIFMKTSFSDCSFEEQWGKQPT